MTLPGVVTVTMPPATTLPWTVPKDLDTSCGIHIAINMRVLSNGDASARMDVAVNDHVLVKRDGTIGDDPRCLGVLGKIDRATGEDRSSDVHILLDGDGSVTGDVAGDVGVLGHGDGCGTEEQVLGGAMGLVGGVVPGADEVVEFFHAHPFHQVVLGVRGIEYRGRVVQVLGGVVAAGGRPEGGADALAPGDDRGGGGVGGGADADGGGKGAVGVGAAPDVGIRQLGAGEVGG